MSKKQRKNKQNKPEMKEYSTSFTKNDWYGPSRKSRNKKNKRTNNANKENSSLLDSTYP